MFYFIAAVGTCAGNNPVIKLHLHIFLLAARDCKIVATFAVLYCT